MNKVLLEKLAMLAGSRKAWIALAAMAAIAILVYVGKVTTPEMLDFYKWVVSAWLASIALEGASNALTTPRSTTTDIQQSITPGDKETGQ